MIEVNNLVKIFNSKSGEFVAVDNISFNINDGEIVGILGSNGAGKSTTIKMMCGLLSPTEGNILILDKNIKDKRNLKYILKRASFLLEGQRNIYYYFSLLENIKYFLSLKGIKYADVKSHVDYLINYFGLQSDLDKPIGSYSTGMKQKASIIIALSGNEEIIVLDEPTLGLDVQSSNDLVSLLKKYVKERRKTVLITCHNMKVIEDICDKVIVIEKGKVIFNGKTYKLKNIFEMNQIEIICTFDSQNEFEGYDLIDNKDGTSLIKIVAHNSQIGKMILDIEEKGARIMSIKSNNCDFESAYVEFIKNYKENI